MLLYNLFMTLVLVVNLMASTLGPLPNLITVSSVPSGGRYYFIHSYDYKRSHSSLPKRHFIQNVWNVGGRFCRRR